MHLSSISAHRAKQRAALISIAAAVGILIFKLLVGLHTHSLGIQAEAAHSALDLIATLMTWFSLRIAAKPADANHPFGHGKFESFSALLQTGLLVATAVLIGAIAVREWVHGVVNIHLDAWAFAVMLTSIAVDWRRAAMLRHAAVTYESDALAADALNFTSDLASSVAVLIGLGLVAVGEKTGWSSLDHADAAAACIVAAVMLALALRLGRQTAGALLDETSPALTGDLRQALEGVEGIHDLERLRLRRSGSRYFVDLRVGLEPATTLERARLVRRELAARIQHRLPDADVVVEAQPRHLSPLSPIQQLQAVAQRRNLNVHDLLIYRVDSGLGIECHLELKESMELAAAHDLVSHLEAEMRAQVPTIRQITTHIEPEVARINASDALDSERIRHEVEAIAMQQPQVLDCHDLQLRSIGGHLALSCHCSFPDSLSVGEVHESITRLEIEIKRRLPELLRITIHPEPGSDNRR